MEVPSKSGCLWVRTVSLEDPFLPGQCPRQLAPAAVTCSHPAVLWNPPETSLSFELMRHPEHASEIPEPNELVLSLPQHITQDTSEMLLPHVVRKVDMTLET